MGIEFNLLKDMAAITNTAVELVAVNRIIKSHIGARAFNADYDSMLGNISHCYQVVIENLEPLLAIETDTDEGFAAAFQPVYQRYIDSYLLEISRPRVDAEYVYEKNLQFRKLKEVGTSFPILKHAFTRLHEIVDKWLDNDIWLAMTIDSLFKLIARLLNEISELTSKDPEHAFWVFQSGIKPLSMYLSVLKAQVAELPRAS